MYINAITASSTLQTYLDKLQDWIHIWKIRISETKSIQITFELIKEQCSPVLIKRIQIPASTSTKYLKIHLDNLPNLKKVYQQEAKAN